METNEILTSAGFTRVELTQQELNTGNSLLKYNPAGLSVTVNGVFAITHPDKTNSKGELRRTPVAECTVEGSDAKVLIPMNSLLDDDAKFVKGGNSFRFNKRKDVAVGTRIKFAEKLETVERHIPTLPDPINATIFAGEILA